MAQYNDTGIKALPTNVGANTSGALIRYRRVYLDSNGVLAHADATRAGLGVIREAHNTSGQGYQEPKSVMLFTKPGTIPCVAFASGIVAGAVVYAAPTGYVAASGTVVIGRALTASTAQGDVIEVMPNWSAV